MVWIGNPFCWPCIPLRLFITLPGGLVFLVMTMAPIMGLAQNTVLKYAPPVFQAHLGGVAKSFFSIGMIFWGVFAAMLCCGSCCYYKFCKEDKGEGKGCLCC